MSKITIPLAEYKHLVVKTTLQEEKLTKYETRIEDLEATIEYLKEVEHNGKPIQP